MPNIPNTPKNNRAFVAFLLFLFFLGATLGILYAIFTYLVRFALVMNLLTI